MLGNGTSIMIASFGVDSSMTSVPLVSGKTGTSGTFPTTTAALVITICSKCKIV